MSTPLQEHIELVRDHKTLFTKAIKELKYKPSDLTKALSEKGIEVSTPLLKKALIQEKLILSIEE